jgi:hypothetical protein
MSRVRCFLSEPTEFGNESLRRYVSRGSGRDCATGYHNASVSLGEVSYPHDGHGGWGKDDLDHVDPRWPTKCSGCDYLFRPEDMWQHNMERLYVGPDGVRFELRSAPPGAMWNAYWMADYADWRGPDGLSLVVMLPDGSDWNIDSVANNCQRKGQPHKCWVRHGTPPDITVDKNGDTCGAGSGSIQTPGYHGFLRNGWLEQC